MCGIGGILSKNSEEVPGQALERMSQALIHRGPDDGGIFLSPDRKAGFVHRRLSIIDLSEKARQPMSNPKGNAHLIFNGEIYNYLALREKLKNDYAFQTYSDSEVILALYQQQPLNLLHELRGMFAFALWDDASQTLLLARDRMGIKPLYYAETERFFLFASEIRALLKTGLVKREPCFEALAGFLAFGSVPSPFTMAKEIKSLPPADYLRYRKGHSEINSYWNFPFSENRTETSSLLPALEDRLQDAVKSHLASDVPVGVFLSGGTDSTAIAALMRSAVSTEIQSFTISFPGYSLDEAPYARLASDTFGTRHTEAPVTAHDFRNSLPDILAAMDQPTVDGVNTFFVSKLAREFGVKVVLSGLGGDELFGGYPSFRLIPKLCRTYRWTQKIPGALTLAKQILGASPSSKIQNLGEFFNSDGTPEAAFFAVRRLFLERERKALLSPLPETKVKSDFNPLQYLQDLSRNGTAPHGSFQIAALLEFRSYMHNQLLRDADVMAMAHGVEVRVPFLDHKLIEFVNGVPTKIKLTSPPKKLLIAALQGKIPKPIYQRRKMGFTFPFNAWMKNELRPSLNHFFQEGPAAGTQSFWDWSAAADVWNQFLENRIHWSRPWSLFVLENWLRINLD